MYLPGIQVDLSSRLKLSLLPSINNIIKDHPPDDKMRHTLSTLALLATTALAGDILPRDACVDACNAKWDACRAAPDANRASCAADFAGCVGYNPFASDTFVAPTACSTSTAITATVTPTPSAAPASACVTACNNAYDACRSKPDANRASCAADYAGCLGYNPFDGSGSLVAPTACAVVSSTSAARNSTAPKTTAVAPPAATTKPVQVAGAGNLKPGMAVLVGVGAMALL
ncbi:hypothetical protein KVR01_013584 [Diaporthe batatas]|uniref:uncharacterized protein n=1 Tax=Diaporthe batatas TaxID=748121 RepID=UPI001D040471|nr:uncharacterized protein KVR01_013584 [Diaporthe batatas]KAG8156480.1 hypothetical protein KVR01_013584 [Diaporthe batatas]